MIYRALCNRVQGIQGRRGRQQQITSIHRRMAKALLVFDFDWSLIECNSDTFVIEEIGAEEIYNRLREQGLPWTALMHSTVQAAQKQLGVTEADIKAALARAPLHPAVAEAVQALADSGQAHLMILSDANSVYIQQILQHYSLKELFPTVFTNPAEFEGGTLSIRPFATELHSCHRLCPLNLCKGQVLSSFLEQQLAAGQVYSRAVYVGDGRGDYCPTVELLNSELPSLVLARSQYPDESPCALCVKLRADLDPGQHDAGRKQRVLEWGGPEELAAHLQQVLDELRQGSRH